MYRYFQNHFLWRSYFSKTELERLLIVSCLFSIALTTIRIVYTNNWRFAGLCWNLFLALVPYLISRYAIRRPACIESKTKFFAVFVAWLLFLPNSFYIITDLFHLEISYRIPLWFDLALIFSFAWNGILLGVVSIWQMEKMLQLHFPSMREWQFVYPLMLLNAFGVYIGRYLRYNSWDVIANPFQLTEDIFYLLIHPVRNRFDWSMILCYTVFMTLIYLAVKRMSKAVW
ncbi:MAG: DUF1361 domain-containing protein [Chitinophagaceae bacterium]|nr:MAG: DUF1361 domain-containing protein [Chitinophagaceae bacterium]